MDDKIRLVVKELPLFQNVSNSSLSLLSAHGLIVSLQKGNIYQQKNTLVCIVEGSLNVITRQQDVLLNVFEKGMIFGMASLFGNQCEDTKIIAKEDCKLLLLKETLIDQLIQTDAIFAKNYICFLSDKIRFLNHKITCFTSKDNEQKLAHYLLMKCDESGNVLIHTSYSELASILNMGRASLYRAIDVLIQQGFVNQQGKQIKINNIDVFKKTYGG